MLLGKINYLLPKTSLYIVSFGKYSLRMLCYALQPVFQKLRKKNDSLCCEKTYSGRKNRLSSHFLIEKQQLCTNQQNYG